MVSLQLFSEYNEFSKSKVTIIVRSVACINVIHVHLAIKYYATSIMCNMLQGTVKLYIEVEDYDPLNSNDHVDDVYVTISLVPNSTFTPRQRYTGIYRNSRIELSFRLQCSSDLYGSNCTTYCVARNDSAGHYSCGSNGEKICLHGWSEPSSNCTDRKH